MKTITLIKGSRGSGKSTLAKKMIGNKKFVYIHNIKLFTNFGFSSIKEDTEYLLVDDITIGNYIKLVRLFNKGKLYVNRPCQETIELPIPNIICSLRVEQ